MEYRGDIVRDKSDISQIKLYLAFPYNVFLEVWEKRKKHFEENMYFQDKVIVLHTQKRDNVKMMISTSRTYLLTGKKLIILHGWFEESYLGLLLYFQK